MSNELANKSGKFKDNGVVTLDELCDEFDGFVLK